MQQDLRRKIISDFPLCYPRYVSIDVGDGWLNLVYETSYKLEEVIKKANLEIVEPPEDDDLFYFSSFEVIQVKSKYAGLRIYMSTETEEMSKIIEEAELKASTMCEDCGEKGQIAKNHGWLTILCNLHDKEV